MNKFTDTRLFLKIVSLLLTVGMYIAVSTDLLDSQKTIATLIPAETIQEETVTDVPVVANYDSDQYIVSGIPETVDVTFKGTSSQLRVTLNKGVFEVVAQLGGLSEGTYDVPLQVTNLDNNVTAAVDPETINVTIEKKVSQELPISLDIQGEDDLQASGYVVTDTSLNTATAEVVGTEEAVERVASLRVAVDVSGKQDSFSETVDITAYDSNGERVDSVSVTPNTAQVTVTIAEVGSAVTSKDVPVTIKTTGTAQSGIFIKSTEVTPETVTIFGEESDIGNVTEVTANIDLSKITESTEETVALTLPDNVRAVSPSKVSVKIQLEEEETRTFSNIPIITRNLSDDLDASFVETSTATVSVTAVPSILDKLTNSSIILFVDLSGLDAGTQTVPLQAEAIKNGSIDTGNQKVKVELTEKNAEDDTTDDETMESGETNGGTNNGTPDANNTEDDTIENGTTDDPGETN